MNKKKKILRNEGLQTFLASIACIIIGLLVGYIVLLIIEPSGAWQAIMAVIKNFFYYPSAAAAMKYFGSTLVKSSALLMCGLSVLFAYKVGLFNIGAAGQYVLGAGAALFCALKLGLPWYICLIVAIILAAISGGISGLLKAYFNVSEVISGIMLNWISLYCVNMLLTTVKEDTSPYTVKLSSTNPSAVLPSLGLSNLFSGNAYVTIGVPIAIIMAIIIWIILDKTKLGYELKATGMNKNAAKYCGMNENRNIILTMAIAGALAGFGAGIYFLTGIEDWSVQMTSLPAMGFNGIAAAFLGGLNPIGTIFSSYFIQHITSGGTYVDTTYYPSQISDLISSLIIYLCGFSLFFKLYFTRFLNKRDERREAKAKILAAENASAENTEAEDEQETEDEPLEAPSDEISDPAGEEPDDPGIQEGGNE